jgi:hypothetical protein
MQLFLASPQSLKHLEEGRDHTLCPKCTVCTYVKRQNSCLIEQHKAFNIEGYITARKE